MSGRSVPSIDPADLGFAEIDVSDVASEFEISLVCHVDLSIAVSGSQGTPAQVAGRRLVAARGITIRTRAPPVGGNRRLHGFCTIHPHRKARTPYLTCREALCEFSVCEKRGPLCYKERPVEARGSHPSGRRDVERKSHRTGSSTLSRRLVYIIRFHIVYPQERI